MLYGAEVNAVARDHGMAVSRSYNGDIVERGFVNGSWAIALDSEGTYSLVSYDCYGGEVVQDLYTDDLNEAFDEVSEDRSLRLSTDC